MDKKLLIVEDDQILNDMYATKFQKYGYEVKSWYDGVEGLSIISSFDPDVVLLDLMMPSMNGFETLEAIKSQTSSKCKIIIFTNVVDRDKIDKAIRMWADDYLIKADTTPNDALNKVESYLEELKEDKTIYVNPGLNKFKVKNPDGWEDIEVEINIKL